MNCESVNMNSTEFVNYIFEIDDKTTEKSSHSRTHELI